MQRALGQKVLGRKPHRELLAFLDGQLPRLRTPPARSAWLRRAAQTRRQLLWPVAYASAAPLFCFGLLREFDLPDLVALCAPAPIHDSNRGPLRANKPR